jgi:CMP-N-acetylneuraminic acid synthetase
MNVLGIIPAKGHSQRLPNKNIQLLGGKPLICWTIEAVLHSGMVDTLVVSTDSQDIVKIVNSYDVDVIMRPHNLTTSLVPLVDVVKHVLDTVDKKFDVLANFCVTVPFRTAKDIKNAFALMQEKNAQVVISVAPTSLQVQRMNTLPADSRMDKFMKEEFRFKNSQELDIFYIDNGAIQIANIPYFYEHGDWYGANTYAYIMSEERSIDINTKLDLEFAKFVLDNKNKLVDNGYLYE